MRDIRAQPFCWQEKGVLRHIGEEFKNKGMELAKFRCLYLTLTQMDSDFNGKEITHYTKSIHKYSGLPIKWVSEGLKKLEQMDILALEEIRDNRGKIRGRKVVFTLDKWRENH